MKRLVLTAIAVIALVIAAYAMLSPFYQFESKVDALLETFAEMPYAAWAELHKTCEELAATGKEMHYSHGDSNYLELPETIRKPDPLFVWVKTDRVTLKFSGGHSRFVVIEFYGDRTPTELELFTEGFFDGIVFPRRDQRSIGRLRGTRP